MTRRPCWTLLAAFALLSCTDTMAPRPASQGLRDDLDEPSMARVLGASSQFIFGSSCARELGAPAIGRAINTRGIVAFSAIGGGKMWPCLSEGSETIRLRLPEGRHGGVEGMNEAGAIVGWTAGADGNGRAAVWLLGQLPIDLHAVLPNAQLSRATAINDAGFVTGHFDESSLSRQAFVVHVDLQTGVVGTPVTLPFLNQALGAARVEPTSINNGGKIVGTYTAPGAGDDRRYAFLWADGAITDLKLRLPIPDALRVVARDINDEGHIVGSYDTRDASGALRRNPVFWHLGGSGVELRRPTNRNDAMVEANAINNAGVIVGSVHGDAAVWHEFVPSIIGFNAQAFDINSLNQAAGHGMNPNNPLEQVALRWTSIRFNQPPTVIVSLDPPTPVEGSPVTFDARPSTDPEGHPIRVYAFDFGDGSSVKGAEPVVTHTYVDNTLQLAKEVDATKDAAAMEAVKAEATKVPASYTLAVALVDAFDGQGDLKLPITVANAPPAPFAGADRTVFVGEEFTLGVDARDPGVRDMPWQFAVGWGDGALGKPVSSSEQTVGFKHMYGAAGAYRVTVTVSDKDGGVGTTSLMITAVDRNRPPIADAGGPRTELEGTAIQFNGSGQDPDGNPLTYSWTFGDESDPGETTGATTPTPTHVYKQNGTYQVKLAVSDGAVSVESSATVTITNAVPTMALVAPPVPEGTNIVVGFADVHDPSPVDVEAGLSIVVDCGEGYRPVPSGETTGSCATDDNGPRVVRAKITDQDGGFSEYSTTVEVFGVAPTAHFAATSPVAEGGRIVLSLGGATDESAADQAAGFRYAFACGTGALVESPGPSTTCDAPDDASIPVRARVSDKDGSFNDYTSTAVVVNVKPVVTIASGAVTLVAGETFVASGAFTDPGADSWSATASYDGGATTQPLQLSSKSFELRNTYASAGTFLVTVTVTDDDNGAGTASVTVTVQSPAQATAEVTSSVEQLVTAGTLTSAEASALSVTLDAAIENLDSGNSTAAINQLQAFQHKVDALVSSGRMSSAQGQELKGAVDRIIRQS